MKMHPHVVTSEDQIGPNGSLAITSPARPEDVSKVVLASMDDHDGRSVWVWLRLANDELALGVFPQGDTYEAVEGFAGHWGDGSRSRTLESGELSAGDPVATVHPANPDYVDSTLSAHLTDNAAPNWSWIRLANGDLAAGVFIHAPLPQVIMDDAAWPGLPGNEPEPEF